MHDFRKSIDEGIRSGEDVSASFRDEEAKIEKLLRKRARALNRKLADEAGKSALHASAAVLTGGVSAIMGAVVAAFGGKHLADTVIPTLRERFQEAEEPRDSQFFYAWKLKKEHAG